MNKIYKVIFNRNKNRYEIVSELASSRGGKCKVKAGKQIAKLFMTGLLATSLSSVASAADEEVKVKYDAATGTIKIVKVSDGSEVASYAVGGNISPITSIGTKNPTGIIAIGDQSKAVQSNSIAIGANAHAGDLTLAKDQNSPEDNSNGYIAIGTKAVVSGDRSIALGNLSSDNGGSYNIVQGKDSIGIGTSTSIFGYSGVSIGRRNIIGVPDPDLVKEGVLTTKARTKYSENDLGGNSVIVGAYNVAYGNRSNIIGTYSRAMGSNSVAIGSGVQSLSDGSIAIGKGSGYEFEGGSRFKNEGDTKDDYYGRDWELPPEYRVLEQVLSNDIKGDTRYKKPSSRRSEYRYENGGTLPKYNNYGAGSSDPGGFIVEGKNALGIGTYTQVRGDSAIGLATGEMTADLSEKDKSQYARDMRKIMDMEETLYDAKEALKSGSTSDKATLEANVKTAEESLAAAKKEFRKNYLSKYSFVEGEGALGVGRQILAQGDRSMAVGDFAKAISNDAIAYGGQTLANGTNSMAMGGNAHVGTEATEATEAKAFDNSMAIGSHTNVQAGNAVALGAFTKVEGENSLALGFGKQSGDDINYNAVSGKNSTLIGSYGNIAGNNSILIGSSGSIANDRVVGLGNNINIEAADQNDQENNTAGSVFLGDHAGYVTDSKRARSLGEVDVVGSKEKMELTESLSSTKGALRDYTKDFIYIYMLENQDDGTKIGAPIAVRSDFAGGDSTVGVVSVGSTYEQTFENLDKIKEHHKKVGSLITVPVEVTVQVTKNGISLGKQQQTRYFAADATQEQINSDSTLSDEDKKKVWNTIQESRKKADTKYTVFETRRIQNVAPGLIGSNSTDAINGSQLFATNQMLGNLVGSLKKTLGDSVTVTEDGQITVAGDINTLGWIAKAGTVNGSNGTVTYDVDKKTDETEEAYQARKAKLEEDGYIVDASKVMTFKAGKNIGLVQKPGEFSISTIDTPSFKSVELRGETKEVNGSQETPVTMMDSSGMQVYTETVTPGDAGPTTTKKVSTTVNNEGVTTDGTVKVTNGKDGDQAKEFVTIDKGTDGPGTDKEYGKIGLDGKNGSKATLTVDRGTKSVTDSANVGKDPTKPIDEDNPVAGMDRLTYTTTGPNNETINHEVATLDDGFMLTTSTDVANSKAPANVKLNHTIKFTDGANTKVSTVTSKDGVHELHVDVTGLPVTYTASVVDDQGNPTNTQNVSKVGDTYQLEDGTKLVKSGDKYYKLDQIENGVPKAGEKGLTIDNSIRVINPEDPSKTAKITNVAPGEADTDAVNMSQLKQKAAAATTEVTGTGAAEVTKVTGANGQNIYNVHVDKLMTVKAVDSATQVARGSDGKYYNADDIAGKTFVPSENKWYNTADVDATTGKPLEGKSALANQPLALDQSKLKNSVVNPNGDGATIVDNVKSGIGGEAGNGIQNGTTIDGTTGNNTFIKNLDKVGKPASEGGIDKTTVVNAGDLKNLADTPLFFSGDSADGVAAADGTDKNTFARKLSQETKIVGGVDLGLQADATAEQRKAAIADKLTDGNIGVISDGTDTLTVKLAKNLVNLTSVETGSGDNKTKMTENGVTTTVKDGDTFKVTTTTPNGLATTEVKLDSNKMPTGESKTTTVTTDGVTITTQTPKNGGKPASTTETKLSKDGLATDGTVKVTNGKTGDDAKDLVTIGKGTETDPNATDKEFGTVAIDGKNGSNATLTVDRGTKSVTDKANILKDPKQPAEDNNPVSMDRLTYTTTGADGKSIIKHEVATLDDGFFLTTEHTEEDKTRTVLFNHTIKVLDGANTKVSAMGGEDGTHTFSIDVTGLPMTYTATDANGKTQDVHKVGDTYTLADGTKLVQVGDKFYKPDQVEEVNGTPQVKAAQEDKDTKLNNISLTSPVANTAPTLSNVGSALKKSDGTRITMSNLDDSSVYPTNNPIWNNAVNVGDLKAATDAARTEVTGTGKAIVTKKTGDKGQNIYNVHVDPIVDVVGADGSKVVRGDDGKYYNPTDIANKTFVPDGKGGGSWYNNSDLTNGKPKPDAKPQTIKTANIKNKMVNPNGGDSIVLDNIKSGIGGEVKDSTHNNENTFIDNINKVGKKSDDGTAAPDAISENTVVNAKDLKNVVDTGFKLNTSGHSGDAQTVKIGDTIQVVDGKNTTVSAITHPTTGVHEFHIDVTGLPVTYTATETDGEGKPTGTPVDVTKTKDGYQKADGTPLIKINENGKDVYYTADQLDNNVPKPGAKGLTITDNIRLINPKDGTGATKITNVAAGTDDTDAVNVSQLKQKVAAATTEVTGTGAAEVTKVTGADGQNVYNVHVDKLMEAKSTEPGKTIVRGSDNKYYYVDDALKQANDGKWYPADQVGADGKPADGAVGKDTTELTVVPADKLKNSLVNPNGNGPTVLDNVKSGIGGKVDDPDSNHENTFMKKVDTIGKANGISENTVVNAGDLKNLVDTGFKLNTSGHSGDAQTVKIGETIKVVDGANTKISDITSTKDGVYEFHIDVTGLPMTYTVSQTGDAGTSESVSKVGDTYQLANGTKLVKVGNKFYKPSQLVDSKADQPEVKPDEVAKNWSVNDSVSLVNKDGSTNAPTLKNVGSGLKDAAGNPTSIDKAVGSNAVNVDDLRTMGKAATTEITGTGAAEVTKVTGANGQNVYNVHVERFMQVAETDVEGNKVVKAADNYYYKEADIKDKTYIDGQWYNNTDIKDKTKIGDKWYNADDVVNGVPKPNATELTVQATTAPNKAVGLQNNLVNPNDNTPTRLSNLASALSGEVGNGANTEDNSAINSIDKNGKPTSKSGSNTFVKNVLDLDATEKTEEQLKTSLGHEPSEDEVKAEKARAEKDKALLNSAVTVADLQKTLQSPLFFEGDSADGVANENDSDKNTFARKLSQKTKIVGGVDLGLKENATADERKKAIADKLTDGNIGVVSNGTDTLTIKLAKNLVNLTSVETGSGNNKTKMTENGVTTTVKDGDTFKVTTTTPNGLATTEVKLDSEGMPKGESTTTMVTTDGVTITTQTPKNGDKPASTTETKLSKDGLATDGTIKVTGDNAKDLVTIGKGTDGSGTDKEYGKIGLDGKNGSNATITVDRGTSSLDDTKNIGGTDPKQDISENNPAKMDRITYTTKNKEGNDVTHEVATLDDGFMLTTSTDIANSKAPANVKLNNTIKFTDGANTKVSTVTSKDGVHELHVDVTGLPMTYTVSQTGGTDAPVSVSKVGDTYQLANGTKLVKVDDKFYKPDQLDTNGQPNADQADKDWKVTNSISLVNPNGEKNAPTLKHVGSGLVDDAGNVTSLADAPDTNAVNVGDLKQVAAAAKTEVTGSGAAEVTKVTGADGQNIYNVHVDKLMTVKPVDANTNIARGGDGKYYNAGDIAGKTFVSDGNGGGSWYNASDVDAKTGKPLTDKTPLDDQPIALEQSKLKNSVVNPNGDGATIVDNVKSGIGGEVKDTSGKNTFIDNINKVGKPASEGGIDKTTVVNAGDLKNLADTPLFFQGDVSSATGTNNTFSRKLSEKVSIVGEVKHGLADTASAEDKANAIRAKLSDGNIGVVSNGTDTLTIKLAKDLTDLHSVTTTDDKGNTTQINGKGLATTADGKITTVTSDGITIVTTDKDGNSVSLTNKGLDNGHHQIINVKSGLLDRQGKPVTLKKASGDILNNAVNVKDLRDVVHGLTDSGKGGGFGLTGNNGEVRKSLGETITLKGGIANKIENGIDMNKPEKATTDKNTYIDVKTSENGSEKIMVVEIAKDLTDLNSAEFTDQEGNTTKMKGDGIYIDKNGDGNADISLTSEGLNNGGNKITNVADGTEDTDAVNVSQLNKLKQEIKQNIGDEINELNAYAPVVYLDKDGNRVIRKGNKFVKKNDETAEIPPQDIRLSLVNADGKTTNPSTLQNVAKGVQDTDAVNVKQLKEATEKPLTFNGDAGSSSAKLGETVAIKGGANSADLTDNNIGVIANSSTKTLNVKLSKKLKGLESAEFVDNNGNTTNITGDGVHISGGNGSNVSLTSQGLNNGGNRITNVAPGVEATDAVNVSQLNQVGAALHNRINNVAKGAYGGVASAGAMASLPQAYLPGKSMVAAGASHYRGESAVALGASRISDNGKIILKLNASHNTSGNTMVGAGVGYQF